MECATCGAPLDRPGDFCLTCRSGNADGCVIEAAAERATVTVLRDDAVVGARTITTTRHRDGERERAALRNYADRIADAVRRARPEWVTASGDRDVVRAVATRLRFDVRRVDDADPVAAALADDDTAPAVVDAAPAEKLGGSHTTLIGNRAGRRAIRTVAEHPHVKKVIPGPIEAGGSGSRGSAAAKATRADAAGNLRLLLREGSSVQEVRIVTTAADRETGERVRAALNDALADADLR